MEPVIIVHGGAGKIAPSRYNAKMLAVKSAVIVGYEVLMRTDNPVDAVEAAVRLMEDDEECNAGYGSVLARSGEVEMDAIIIRGSDLSAGAVGAVKHVAHPITLAKMVMEKTQHVMLVAQGAEEFAKSQGMEIMDNAALVSPRAQQILNLILSNTIAATTETGVATGGEALSTASTEIMDKLNIPNEGGTVGAVAINSKGEMAAATSTGGLAGKLPGRVGDTPIIGGGTLCDDKVCGVSATGLGESIMRYCVASKISSYIEAGMSCSDACLKALEGMTERTGGGDGGAIVITKDGDVGYNFNSEHMAWAFIKNHRLEYGLVKNEATMDILPS